jgi:hypothetical protein
LEARRRHGSPRLSRSGRGRLHPSQRALSLALIHKTIGFYLENRTDIDAYIAQCRDEIERHASTAPRGPGLAELRQRLAARRTLAS